VQQTERLVPQSNSAVFLNCPAAQIPKPSHLKTGGMGMGGGYGGRGGGADFEGPGAYGAGPAGMGTPEAASQSSVAPAHDRLWMQPMQPKSFAL